MKSATAQLREELFDALHRLKTGQIDAATAQAVSKIGGKPCHLRHLPPPAAIWSISA